MDPFYVMLYSIQGMTRVKQTVDIFTDLCVTAWEAMEDMTRHINLIDTYDEMAREHRANNPTNFFDTDKEDSDNDNEDSDTDNYD